MSLISIATSTLGCHLLTPTPQMALMMKVPVKRVLSSYHRPPIGATRRFYHCDPRPPSYERRATEQRPDRPAAFTPSPEIRRSPPAFGHSRARIGADETQQPSEHTSHHDGRILAELHQQLASAEQQRAETIKELRMLNQMTYYLARRKVNLKWPDAFDPKTGQRISDADKNKRQEDHDPKDERLWAGERFAIICLLMFLAAVVIPLVVASFIALRMVWTDMIAWLLDYFANDRDVGKKNTSSSSSLSPRFH